MLKILRTHLALRSAAIMLLIVGGVGCAFLALAVWITEDLERERQTARLNELLDTVESTVSIAAFLGDRQLAGEVTRGLLKNRTVAQVSIYGSTGLISASGEVAPGADNNAAALERKIYSPFNPEEVVGDITLIPNETEIRIEVQQSSRFIVLLLIVQLACIGIGVIAVVVRLITRPILKISRRLHELRAENGEKLAFPKGNEDDEIGRLVSDVNTLIDYLVNILEKERSLRIQREVEERKFRTIFENAETGIFLIDDDGTLLSSNPAFKRFFDLQDDKVLSTEMLKLSDLTGLPRDSLQDLIGQCLRSGRPSSRDIELTGLHGQDIFWVNIILNAIENSRLQGVVNDITERKLAEEAATELAITDALTGLTNRRGLERKLDAMIELCRRDPSHRFALLLLDLDEFKPINDTHGHQAGDLVLRHVAKLLIQNLRKTDVVARLGGDEFVIVLDGMHHRDAITTAVEKIFAQMTRPITITAGVEVTLGLSLGVAIFGQDADTSQTLIKAADQAMYNAKQAGRNTYRFAE